MPPNVVSVAAASSNGKYTLTVHDETDQTSSVKITNMGSGGFYWLIYNNDFSGDTISTKFAKSKTLSIEIKGPSLPTEVK